MLTLTVKDNETLHIGDDIKIVIKKSSGSGNKVCIEAPEAVKILRDKLNTSRTPYGEHKST